MMNVIAGHDLADSTSVNESVAPVRDYLEKLDEPIERLKIAVVPEFNAGADQQVQKALTDTIEIYRALGAEVIEITMPHLDYAIAAYYVIATAEASSNLARYDGVHYGHRSENAADLQPRNTQNPFREYLCRPNQYFRYSVGHQP